MFSVSVLAIFGAYTEERPIYFKLNKLSGLQRDGSGSMLRVWYQIAVGR
jgi:hypothetical protein